MCKSPCYGKNCSSLSVRKWIHFVFRKGQMHICGFRKWILTNQSKKNTGFYFPVSGCVGATVDLKCKIADVMCQLLQLLRVCHLLHLMAATIPESTLDALSLYLSQSVIVFPPSSYFVAGSILHTLIVLLGLLLPFSFLPLFSCSLPRLQPATVWYLVWFFLGGALMFYSA